ncbi:aldehyde dehydrogenase family protein, partial [candidate division KSB1 bacterium]|nr:aldehyde dehydrogenase family protein [candidate division KSB1 bacterium]
MFINGQWVAMSPEARTLASVNPASLENIGSFPCADQGLVNQAVEAAWGAFPGWRDLGVRGRVEKLKGLSRIIIDRSDEIARLITQEMGKPLVEAYASEIFGVVALIRYYCKKAPSLLRPRRVRYYQPLFWGKRGILELEPLGPFAVISPWNYPFGLPIGSIFPALVTGCPVIFKPSEYSTLVGIKIAELSEELNLSPGVFNLVTG